MRLILHIGLPKTGSTTIQNCLDTNAGRLAKEADVAVLSGFGLGSNSFNLSCYALRFRPKLLRSNFHLRTLKVRNRMQFERLQSSLRDRFLEEVDKLSAKTLIVSSEAFSAGLKSEEEIAKLVKLFREVATDIRVIVYLRRQDEAVLSAYSQAIKGGAIEPFSLLVPEMYLDYKPLLDRWSYVVGHDNIAIGLLEKASLYHGDLLDDFFHKAGVEISAISRTPTANASLSADALEFLRRLNQHIAVFDPEIGGQNKTRGNVVSLLNRWSLNRKRLELTPDQRAEILATAKPFNSVVAREYFGRNDGQLFAPVEVNEGADKDSNSPGALSVDDAMAITAFIWANQQSSLSKLQKKVKTIEMSRSKLIRPPSLLSKLEAAMQKITKAN